MRSRLFTSLIWTFLSQSYRNWKERCYTQHIKKLILLNNDNGSKKEIKIKSGVSATEGIQEIQPLIIELKGQTLFGGSGIILTLGVYTTLAE